MTDQAGEHPGSGRTLLLLVLLLVAEASITIARFRMETVAGAGGMWGALAGESHLLSSVVICVAASVVAFGGRRVVDALLPILPLRRRRVAFVALHLASWIGFLLLTRYVLEGGFSTSEHRPAIFTAWIASALGTAGTWLATLAPARALAGAARRLSSELALVLLVGLGAWLAGQVTASLWGDGLLTRGTLLTAHALLRPFLSDLDPVDDTPFLGAGDYRVEILPACSGAEGIGLMLVFTGTLLLARRRTLRFPRALLVPLVATVLVWVANAARIAALVVVGAHIDPEVAGAGFHSKAGWLLFCSLALAAVATVERGTLFRRERAPAGAGFHPYTLAHLLPLLCWLGVAMLTGLWARGLDPFYPLRVAAALLPLVLLRRHLTETWSRPSLVAPACGLAVAVLWWSTAPPGADPAPRLEGWPPWWEALWWTSRVVGYVLVVPVVEELAFRGYGLRRLVSSDLDAVRPGTFTPLSFVLTSLLFGLLHQQVLVGSVAGALFALAFYRRGRLLDAVVAHATANALLTVAAFATGRWNAWT